jgi:Na+/H+ antiporter NhaB
VAPLILLIMTRLRMPVSTSLLLIGIFTTKAKAFVDVVQKSAQSYGIAFGVAIAFYSILYRGPIKEFLTCEDKPAWL